MEVGDIIQHKNSLTEAIITVKLGPILYIGEEVLVYLAEDIKEDFKLVLTDYEKELTKSVKEKVIPFKKGDKVLVRRSKNNRWEFDFFEYYDNNTIVYPYICEKGNYPYCIPINEKTWKLLGTTNEYKEE